MLRLLVTHGREEQSFAIPEGEATLGRAEENDLVLRIPGVSRKHAVIRRLSGGLEIKERGRTKNGLLVEGVRVTRTILTPRFQVQIGEAWLEVEEVSTAEEAFFRLHETSSERSVLLAPITTTAGPKGKRKTPLPSEAALALAYQISQVGVGVPDERGDLLLRVQATLGAEAFATLERARSGRLRLWESVGTIPVKEVKRLTELAGEPQGESSDLVMLKRSGATLLAGRDDWFLVAKLPTEVEAREGWRREFLRFLVSQFFRPVRSLGEANASEVARVYALSGENARRTAKLLAVSPGKLYSVLEKLGLVKRRPR
jgi:pSer/pThr/pTyr-binding forkhead associated (FHA) protein